MDEIIRQTLIRKETSSHHGAAVELYEQNGVTLCRFPLFKGLTWLCHGFSTRLGGVSEGVYASMNLSFHRGDETEAVMENYRRICGALGVSPQQLVFSDQTHTANVRKVTKEDGGKGITKPMDYQNIDALITNQAGLMLTAFYADCVPVFLIDAQQKAIGLVHSGWRGTVQKISEKTIEAMQREYGSQPSHMLAVIGPSICGSCYEVSVDVTEAFCEAFTEKTAETFFWRNERGRYQLDLWEANKRILLDAGLLDKNIQVTDICTCCNPQILFSHRASQGKRGNLAAFLGIKTT